MFNFQKISLLLTMLFLLGKPVISNNRCTDKCGRVHIQFPFYLRNHTTSYPPGFGLFCNDKDETVLELPAVPVKLFVKRIDYKSQKIQIYDPENCLPKVFLKLGNSSIYPFKFQAFVDSQQTDDVSFFLCNSMSCPIFQASYKDLFYPEMISCTKVEDVLSVEWYVDYWEGPQINSVMKWPKHNCSHCEAQGQKCKWKNGTQGETECFICPTNTIPTSTIIRIVAAFRIEVNDPFS
ncbi:RING-H2 finger protein ATL22 [Spatholobus suberectus]|nr:RING-H2 finger protein ATL22 [Spatholobus suberectus]